MTTVADHSTPTHPRPQLTRAWESLDGTWQFAYDDGDTGLDAGWHTDAGVFDREITVPFPPESALSGIGDTGPHPHLWYRRTFTAAPGPDERVILHFNAVDYEATVWVNGHLAVRHTGGHTPFEADVTRLLVAGGEQVVVVRTEDQPDDVSQPRGKQVWGGPPRNILYHRTSGIWQPVWLETVHRHHIARLVWRPDARAGAFGLAARIAGPASDSLRLRVRLSREGQLLTDDTFSVRGGTVKRTVRLPDQIGAWHASGLLWTPDRPTLIDAELTLLDGETVVDEAGSYAGLRSVGVRNGKFVLNDRPLYLRMALEQGYWPDSHLAAPSDDALREEVELAKALGFNGVRVHQKVEDPRFLYWCDRLGLLTWGEMPAAYAFDDTAMTRFTREWTEAIQRDISHPCVVAWVPTNESWGVPDLEHSAAQRAYTRALADLARALDGSRPVISNDGWEHTGSDILALHDYGDSAAALTDRWADRAATDDTLATVAFGGRRAIMPDAVLNPDAPLMLTEVGGIGYPRVPGERWHFWSAETTDQLRDKYAELIGAILASETVVGFCYTQLTDTMQERNGLLDEHRQPKLPVEEIHAITTGASRALPRI